MDVTITGAEDFEALSDRIKRHADRRAIQRELYSGLNRVTKDVRSDMKRSLAQGLPSGGGAAAKLSREAGLRTTAKSGRETLVRIVTSRRHNYRLINQGLLRHPVFGNRQVWVSQPVTGELLEKEFTEDKPEIQRAIQRVMAEVARKVEG